MWKEISVIFTQSTPFMQLGATWHAGSRRIRTISWARLNTTLFLTVHRLFFLQLSFQLIRGGQNQTPPPSLCLPNTSIKRSPLPTVNCQQANAVVPKSLLSYFFMLFVVSNKAWGAFCKNPLMFRTNKHNERQLRKSALGLRLQSTLMPLFAGHICIWVTKGSHTACCCVNVSGKGEVPARTHPPFRLSLSLLHAYNKQQTLRRHISATPSKADVVGWIPSKQGNILWNGLMSVVHGYNFYWPAKRELNF